MFNYFQNVWIHIAMNEMIGQSNLDAQALGLTGTPAFYVISTDTQQIQFISGAQPYEVFERIFQLYA